MAMIKKPRKNTTSAKTGQYKGKSLALGGGGRAAKLRDEGVPGPVIGSIARSKHVFGHNDFKRGAGKGTRPSGV